MPMDVFKQKFICADSTIDQRGKFRELIGVATVFEKYGDFRKLYFDVIEDSQRKFDIEFNKTIIKSNDIIKKSPTFLVKEVTNYIVENLLQSDSISFVTITNTHINKSITYPWDKKKKISGIEFLQKELSQYYPIIPVWRYFGRESQNDLAKLVILDGINGKITQAWADIGKKAEKIYIVPYGDWTHPAISFCDLLSYYVKRNVNKVNQQEMQELLIKKTIDKEKIYTSFVSDHLIDRIKPKYPHSIKPYIHYLHPLFLIYSKQRKRQIPSEIFDESELFNISHQLAELHGGSSFYMDLKNDFPILRKGDVLICTDKEGLEEAEQLLAFYPSKGFKIMDVEEFFSFAKEKLKN